MTRSEGALVKHSHHFFEVGEISSASWNDVACV